MNKTFEEDIKNVSEEILRDTSKALAESIKDKVPVETGTLYNSISNDDSSVTIGASYASEVDRREGFVALATLEVLGDLDGTD